MRTHRPSRSRVRRPVYLVLLALIALCGAPAALAGLDTGMYNGNGATSRTITGLKFQPDVVIIKGDNDQATVIRTSTMPDGQCKALAGDTALAGNLILRFTADGFVIGSGDAVNADGVDYVWTAFQEAAGKLIVGSYLGLGLTPQSFATSGFQPAVVFVMPANSQRPHWTSQSLPAGQSLAFDNEGLQSGLITDLLAQGFRVGVDPAVNQLLTVYHYVTWAPDPAALAVGSYLGDGGTRRHVSDLGLTPTWAMVKGEDALEGVHRSAAMGGHLSAFFGAGGYSDAALTKLDPGELELGSDFRVNEAGRTYHYFAVRDAAVQTSDLAMTLTVDRPTARAGDAVAFTLTVANTGPDDALGVLAHLSLPAGLIYTGSVPDDGTYDMQAGEWSPGSIDSGSQATLTVLAEIESGTAGQTLVATAAVASPGQVDPDPADNEDSAGIVVAGHDLAVTLTVSDPTPIEGDQLQITATVTNAGPAVADAVALVVTLPVDLSFNSASASVGHYSSPTHTWDIGSLADGTSASLLLTVRAVQGSAGLTLPVSVDLSGGLADDTDPLNNAASVEIVVSGALADLGVTLAADDLRPDEGQTANLNVTVTNIGPDTATGAAIAIGLPAQLVPSGHVASLGTYSTATGLWTVGTLLVGQSATLQISAPVAVGAGGSTLAVLAAVAATDVADRDEANDSARIELVVTSADLALAAAVDDVTPDPGATVTFTFTLRDNGPDAASGVTVSVLLPPELQVSGSSAATGAYDVPTGVWSVPALAVGAATTLQVQAVVSGTFAGENVTTSAQVIGADQSDPADANNEVALAIGLASADLALTLAVDNPAPNEGDTVVVTATVENLGPDAATGVSVAGVMASHLVDLGGSASHGTYDPAQSLWLLGALPAGDTATLQITTQVAPGSAGQTLVIKGNIAGATQSDAVAANNADIAQVVVTSADLGVSLALTDTTPDIGQAVSATVTLGNAGPDPATGVAVAIPLPAGLEHAGHTTSTGSYDPLTGVWNVGALAAGTGATLQVDAVVAATAGGLALPLEASIAASDQGDPVATDNRAVAMMSVPSADLALGLAVDDGAPDEGQTIVWSLTLANQGPDDATGVALNVALPAGLVYSGHMAGAGTYDSAGGVWLVGGLTAGQSHLLQVSTTVDAGTAGDQLNLTALVAAAGQYDPAAGNDSANAFVTVTSADLAVTLAVNDSSPDEGQALNFTISLTNRGPDAAGGVALTFALPAGITFTGSSTARGIYDQATGIWSVGSMVAGSSAAMQVSGTVNAATGGSILTADARVTASDQGDPAPADNQAARSLTVAVPAATVDLGMNAWFEPASPLPGETTTLYVVIGNGGEVAATGIASTVTLPSGLTSEGFDAGAGTYAPGTGTWEVAALAIGAVDTLSITCLVGAVPGGTVLTAQAAVTAVDQPDAEAANNSATSTLTVADRPSLSVRVRGFAEDERRLLPGGPAADVLVLELANDSDEAMRLSGVTFANPSTGPSSQVAQDAAWSGLELHADAVVGALWSGTFTAGLLTCADLDVSIAARDTLRLTLRGAAALTAPDGLQLRPVVADTTAFTFTRDVAVAAAWPLAAPGVLAVDGMTAAQITLHEVGAEVFQLGSTRNLALDFTIPGNGSVEDELTRLNVQNLGEAAPGEVLTRVEAWADDGDGAFDAAADTRISELHWTGDRWEATGLHHPAPVTGLRVMIVVDIAADALGGTLRLALPAGDDTGIGVASGNDGPIDVAVINPYTQTISATDRVIVTTAPITARRLAPGQTNVPLLHLLARNLYAESQTLTRVQVRNLSRADAGATAARRDSLLTQVNLRLDGNNDGRLDGIDVDPLLGSTVFTDGVAAFGGLNVSVAPDAIGQLFVTGAVSLGAVADGDTISAVLGGGADLQFARTVALVGSWPLDSGARHWVDGMVAAQVRCPEVPPVSLTAGEGPVLALDLTVPGNGYLTDTLTMLRLVNRGTATPADMAALQLWADDGDGIFDAALDLPVAGMAGADSNWVASGLDLEIPVGGRRLFAGVTVVASPGGAATVKLAVPVDGLTMASANDGPRDVAVVGPTSLLISDAPLLTVLRVTPAQSTEGQAIGISMTVTNVSGEDVIGIVPSALTTIGSGSLTVTGAPAPASLDLPAGDSATFTWTGVAVSAGTVSVLGSCEGTGAVGNQVRRSLESASGFHVVRRPASGLGLYPVANMPISVNRGQSGVVPMTLTFVNDGDEATAEVRLTRLVLSLADGTGAPVVPAALLSRVIISEGVTVYSNRTDLETSGHSITLDLDPPVIVTTREPVTIGMRLDVLADTVVPAFRVNVEAATDLGAFDHVSSAPLDVTLLDGDFPVTSGTCQIVARATGLTVIAPAQDARTAGLGQDDVELLHLELLGGGDPAFPSDVQIGSLAVSLLDSLGQVVTGAALQVDRLRVVSPLAVHAEIAWSAAVDGVLTIQLLPPVVIPVGTTPVSLDFIGRIATDASIGPFRLHLAGTPYLDARDGNVGTSVPVSYEPAEITGEPVVVQKTATMVTAVSTALLPASVGAASRAVPVMSLRVQHPGDVNVAGVVVDTLKLRCLNQNRQPLDPSTLLDRLRVNWGDLPCADLAPQPSAAGTILVPLAGVALQAGGHGDLSIRIDLEDVPGASGFEIVVPQGGLVGRDANLGSPVVLSSAGETPPPFSSGVAMIVDAADELTVAMTDIAPPLLGGVGEDIVMAEFVLRNNSPTGSGDLVVTGLVIRARAEDLSDQPVGASCLELTLNVDGIPWAVSGDLAQADSVATLSGAQPLTIPAASARTVRLSTRFHESATGVVSLGVRETDVLAAQPAGMAGAVRVRPAPGMAFPFWTTAGRFNGLGLAESYINFPNPFAAGRESTAFAFTLPQTATVTLRVFSPRGEPVTTVIDRREFTAGLHQDVTWDGRNGEGLAVRSGVYLAELVVEHADGSRDRLLRKVAVVR